MGSHRSGAADDKAHVAKRAAKKTYLTIFNGGGYQVWSSGGW
jgi:hypothetical protein